MRATGVRVSAPGLQLQHQDHMQQSITHPNKPTSSVTSRRSSRSTGYRGNKYVGNKSDSADEKQSELQSEHGHSVAGAEGTKH
jgi:hypothetical protein